MKEITLKSPVMMGVKEDGTVNELKTFKLREPTAGDLRGISLKNLVAENKGDEWITLLSRITIPQIPVSSLNIIPFRDFASLMLGATELLGEEQGAQEIDKS
ncbi:Phage tail protein E [Candidatus Hepatincolaceae symbiont of Richtersius coronifer]